MNESLKDMRSTKRFAKGPKAAGANLRRRPMLRDRKRKLKRGKQFRFAQWHWSSHGPAPGRIPLT